MRVCQISILVIFGMLCTSGTVAQTDSTSHSVDTPREALERALQYTGFNEIQKLLDNEKYSGVEVIICKDSTIPFLVDQVYNRPVWKVSVENVRLDGPNWLRETVESQTPKNFTVVLDSTGGFFVKAYSVYEGYDPQLAPEPSAAHAEKRLRFKAFTGFCASIPPITLFDALGRAAGSDPLGAKEIVAYLVKYKGNNATWQIIGRGIAPLYPLLSGPPPNPETDSMLYMVNRGRTVIDAESAALLEISNQPLPELRPEHR
ncbi:MAG: hypothetical protein AB1483_10420 [Candidatus Zixiibacteriota bacterium]